MYAKMTKNGNVEEGKKLVESVKKLLLLGRKYVKGYSAVTDSVIDDALQG